MNCKNCQAELEEGVTLCPNCGTENAVTEEVQAPEAVEAPEAPVAAPEAPVETPVEAAKPGLSAGKIALLVGLAVAALAVIIALIVGGMSGKEPNETTEPSSSLSATGESTPATIPPDGNHDDATCKGSYTVDDETMNAQMDTVVATMGEAKLTNSQLQVYYWMQVYDFLEQYGSYASIFGMDLNQSLDTQVSIDGTQTWQQYFLSAALDTWRNYQVMVFEAQKAGYVLDAEYTDYLATLPEDLAQSAVEMGYESAEAMVQGDMGPGATLAGYLSYLEQYYMGYMYYNDHLNALVVTDAEIEAFFDSHSEEYLANGLEKGEDTYVDVRHILLQPEGGTTAEDGTTTYSDAEWEACRQAANEVLNTWLSGEQTEEAFAALANQYSTDGGSNTNGGLYTDVYKGQMVEPFENWCFDASRKYGDYGIVETTYGCHVMYFVGSDLIWQLTAKNDLLLEKGNEFLQAALANYSMETDYTSIVLGNVALSSAQ